MRSKVGLVLFVWYFSHSIVGTVTSKGTEPIFLGILNETSVDNGTDNSILDSEICDNENSSTCSTSKLAESDSSTLGINESTLTSIGINTKPESSTQSVNSNEENEKVMTNTTSIPELTTSTTTAPVTETPGLSYSPSQYCTCDVRTNECDINCCCDTDCSKLDKQVFSHCLSDKDPFPEDPHHCFKTNFIYRNNTPFSIIKHHAKGLFCIAKDNLPERYQFIDISVIQTAKQFQKVLKRKRKKIFTWPPSVKLSKPDLFILNSSYKFGSKMWVFSENSTLKPFKLQTSSSSLLCDGESDMHYLQDWNNNCLRKIPKNIFECESGSDFLDMLSFYAHINLVTNPSMMNVSQLECMEESCSKFNPMICNKDMKDCVNDIKRPKYDEKSNSCMNVPKKVLYTIYHNGTQGIVQADVLFHLINVTLSGSGMFRQNFEINFRWATYNDTSNLLRRSGKPGYLEGRPIISAQTVIETVDGREEHSIALSSNPQHWLTVATAGSNGECSSDRLNINFRQNLHSECKLQVPCDCFSAKNESWYAILGVNAVNATNINKINLHVSSYGDPNITNLNGWVPVVVEAQSNPNRHKLACQNIFSNINIRIAYSKFGTFKRPQAKIIGVFINIFESERSIIEMKNKTDMLHIMSSVSFIDVSKPAITRFADPPVYEIKLPTDFFYPFLSSGTRLSLSFCAFFCVICNVISIII